ncbi:energy-coupling factor transporter transmembrane component T family protein [Geobacillus sp. Y412MC52]|uniref:energy-coupling factor transporter transmembrane component T family protein n=1 Tax=Geobacillus sp. (strain Y412MC52) TaxID=550542 RepID=UPI00018C0D39|nr:CbiQ family ECF transporter T component [Geobacillus sp. Y412MC52]ADU94181.1 cobalt transport protein [Geobacillus sp. Y412MC52]ALA71863.1 cobalt ABC transporter permease [Geobacillus stearothermophilus 10]
MIREFDRWAYDNRLRTWRAEWKLLMALAMLFVVMIGGWREQWLVLGGMAYWIIGRAGVPFSLYGKAMLAACIFLGLSLLTLVVSVSFPFQFSIVDSQLQPAAQLAIRSLAAWSCLFFVLITTPAPELFAVLRRMRLPAALVELCFLMYRFIFLLEQAAAELMLALRARNGGTHWRHGGMLMYQLWIKAWQSYEAFSRSLAARGGMTSVVYTHQPLKTNMHLADITAGVVMVMLLLGLEWWKG